MTDPTMPPYEPSAKTAKPVFSLPPGAPAGGMEGCPGFLVLDVERNNCGSWSTPCCMVLSLDCQSPGCWWGRVVEGPITAETFRAAKQLHDADTLWPSDSAAPLSASTAQADGEQQPKPYLCGCPSDDPRPCPLHDRDSASTAHTGES